MTDDGVDTLSRRARSRLEPLTTCRRLITFGSELLSNGLGMSGHLVHESPEPLTRDIGQLLPADDDPTVEILVACAQDDEEALNVLRTPRFIFGRSFGRAHPRAVEEVDVAALQYLRHRDLRLQRSSPADPRAYPMPRASSDTPTRSSNVGAELGRRIARSRSLRSAGVRCSAPESASWYAGSCKFGVRTLGLLQVR